MGPRRQVELAEPRGVGVSWLRAAWRYLCIAADLLVPHLLTEDVALRFVGGDRTGLGSYEIVCCMNDVQPGEAFDAVATVDSFGWLNIGIPARVRNVRPWSPATPSGRQA